MATDRAAAVVTYDLPPSLCRLKSRQKSTLIELLQVVQPEISKATEGLRQQIMADEGIHNNVLSLAAVVLRLASF